MDLEDVCDTGLVLGLGLFSGRQGTSAGGKQEPKHSSSSFHSSDSLEPSLTLGRQQSMAAKEEQSQRSGGRQSSPHSMASSFSNAACPSNVKRERDVCGEEVELERVSSRISDEEEDGSAKKKLRLTKEQSALLEERFKEHSTLNPKQKTALAKQLKLRPRQVEVWFQNRRARTKLKQTEVDCEFLKRCCESLTDENRRLQKELQQLKALKLSAPLYMQIPAAAAATLSMCPSCERIGGGGGDSAKESATAASAAFVVAQKPHLYNPFTHSSSAAC